MGVMADRLNAMVVKVSSPDGHVEAELRNPGNLRVWFRDESYRRYGKHDLEHQISRLAKLVWLGYQRAYDDALAEATGFPVDRSGRTWDDNRRRFRGEQAEITAEGTSGNGFIVVKTCGMVCWQVDIGDEVLSRLTRDEFLKELMESYQSLRLDYRAKMARLRVKHYGSGFMS